MSSAPVELRPRRREDGYDVRIIEEQTQYSFCEMRGLPYEGRAAEEGEGAGRLLAPYWTNLIGVTWRRTLSTNHTVSSSPQAFEAQAPSRGAGHRFLWPATAASPPMVSSARDCPKGRTPARVCGVETRLDALVARQGSVPMSRGRPRGRADTSVCATNSNLTSDAFSGADAAFHEALELGRCVFPASGYCLPAGPPRR